MRESFARRVALFLVLALLVTVATSASSPFRSAFAGVVDTVSHADVLGLTEPVAVPRMLTPLVMTPEDVELLKRGELPIPYRLGDSAPVVEAI